MNIHVGPMFRNSHVDLSKLDTNKLFTINIKVYKASVINSIISILNPFSDKETLHAFSDKNVVAAKITI